MLIGAGLAPHVDGQRLAATLVAFGLAVGLAAHALDELRGRPLGTTIASPVLAGVAAVTLVGAAAIGAVGVTRVGWGLAPFIVAGVVLVVGYNLELVGRPAAYRRRLRRRLGGVPARSPPTTPRPAPCGRPPVLGAAFAYGLSRAQRVLSREARLLRRRVASVTGVRVGLDGTRQAVSRTSLLQPLEQALVALSWASCCLGLALVAARTGH